MRGGDHVFILWIINNYNKNEVLFFNNVRDINNLDDRIVSKKDTRIIDLKDKVVNNLFSNHKIEIYSYESQLLTNELFLNINLYLDNLNNKKEKNIFTILIRNPYNNFASLLKYIENGGNSIYVKDIVNNVKKFINIWISLAENIIDNKNNFIPIVYDIFIINKNYRKLISKKLGVNLINNKLLKSKFGKGSSFGNNFNYNERYKYYIKNEKMKLLLNNKKINNLWNKIYNELTN